MNIWVTENQTPNLRLSFRVKRIVDHGESEFQRCDVYDTYEYGRLMMLDDVVMLTEKDEFFYHEMMAHVPLCVHPDPKKVLVIGGGDGGTIREVARHPEVQEITLVEIDQLVIDMAKKHMPFTAKGFDDPRVTTRVEDGIQFIRDRKNAFDIILIDSTDPVSFAEGLFHSDFYSDVRDALTENGIMVAQTEYPLLVKDTVRQIYSALAEVFPLRFMYTGIVPTYPTGLWSYGFASKGPHPLKDFKRERADRMENQLRYYSGGIHQSAFVLPPFIRDLIR